MSATTLEQQAPSKQETQEQNELLVYFPFPAGSVFREGSTATAQSTCFEGILCRHGFQEKRYNVTHYDMPRATTLSKPINPRTPSPTPAQLLSTAVALQLCPRPQPAGLHSHPVYEQMVLHLPPQWYGPKLLLVRRALLLTRWQSGSPKK